MYITKTQQFYYFQNKAKHYDTIKNIKPSIDSRLQKQYMKTIIPTVQKQQKSKKRNNRIPLMKQLQTKIQNQNMINRLVKMYQSQRTEVSVQGNYSRFNKVQRKFRETNPYRSQINRTINIYNEDMNERIKKIKPRIGSSIEWNQHFGKTMNLKKNMSRYLEENKSKGSLHISADRFIPRYYGSFVDVADRSTYMNGSPPKQIQITHDGILTLPNIKSNVPSHTIKYTKNKLIIDRSRSSLSGIKKNLQQSVINPEIESNIQKKPKRKQLEFKFETENSQTKLNQNKKQQSSQNSKNQS